MSGWKQLHWITRISTLGVLVAILRWQSRFIWTVHNPMYGWPMPFNNVWHEGRGWCVSILILDAAVWLLIAVSVGYTIERWQRKPHRWQYTVGSLLALQAVFATVLGIGCIERYLRLHPNNFSLLLRHACLDWCNVKIWFDIGLFTDPPQFWPFTRIVVILGIGCAVYTGGSLLCFVVSHIPTAVRGFSKDGVSLFTQLPWRHGGNSRNPIEDKHPRRSPKHPPIIASVVIWILVAVLGMLLIITLPPPVIL